MNLDLISEIIEGIILLYLVFKVDSMSKQINLLIQEDTQLMN